jgi:hypothetical protein
MHSLCSAGYDLQMRRKGLELSDVTHAQFDTCFHTALG